MATREFLEQRTGGRCVGEQCAGEGVRAEARVAQHAAAAQLVDAQVVAQALHQLVRLEQCRTRASAEILQRIPIANE